MPSTHYVTTMTPSLWERATSGFPLSISTGFAMESLFRPTQAVYDPERVAPPKVDLSQYQSLWINIATLYRNITTAADKQALEHISPKHALDVMLQEIDIIQSLCHNEGNGLLTPHFYHVEEKNVLDGLHHAYQLRQDNTPGQKVLSGVYQQMLTLLHQHSEEIQRFTPELRPHSKDNAMLLSHHPFDLLSANNFRNLDLLESHTGKLKKRHQWNTKYFPMGKRDMSFLPFHKVLLMTFGDKQQIMPLPHKLREQVLEVGTRRQWTPTTTRDRIMLEIELDIKEPYVVQVLRSAR